MGKCAMRLVTGCNERYYHRMKPYLYSLEQHADFECMLIAVGFEAPQEYTKIKPLVMDREINRGAPSQSECIQHGSFLNVMNGEQEEVILYTDGDMVMQRPLDDEERTFLDLSFGEVVASWNGGAHETLELEAGRLQLKKPLQVLRDDWGVLNTPIYNCGFLAMRRDTWEDVYNNYMQDWDDIGEYFEHGARQQWLMSYTIARLKLDVKIAPWSLHAHGHFGMKPGMTRRGNFQIYHDGKLAAWRHFL